MRHVLTFQRADGVTALRPSERPITRSEWYLAAFTVLLVAGALFVATAMPGPVLLGFVVASLSGELCFGVRSLGALRNPPAEVVALRPEPRHRANRG